MIGTTPDDGMVTTYERARPEPSEMQDDEMSLARSENRNFALGMAVNRTNMAIGDDWIHLQSHLRFAMTPSFAEMPDYSVDTFRKHVIQHLERLVARSHPVKGESPKAQVVSAAMRILSP